MPDALSAAQHRACLRRSAHDTRAERQLATQRAAHLSAMPAHSGVPQALLPPPDLRFFSIRCSFSRHPSSRCSLITPPPALSVHLQLFFCFKFLKRRSISDSTAGRVCPSIGCALSLRNSQMNRQRSHSRLSQPKTFLSGFLWWILHRPQALWYFSVLAKRNPNTYILVQKSMG